MSHFSCITGLQQRDNLNFLRQRIRERKKEHELGVSSMETSKDVTNLESESNEPWWKHLWSRLIVDFYVGKNLRLARSAQGLKPADFLPIEKGMGYRANFERWRALRQPVTAFSLIRLYGLRFLVLCLIGWFGYGLQVFQTFYLFQKLSQYLGDPTQQSWVGWVLVVAIFVSALVSSWCAAQVGILTSNLGVSLKSGFQSTVYRKAMALKNLENIGLVNNLLTNDR